MSVAVSGTIKTNPVLTWPERAQALTGQRRRKTEELERARRRGVGRTPRRWDDGNMGPGMVGRWDPGGRAPGGLLSFLI